MPIKKITIICSFYFLSMYLTGLLFIRAVLNISCLLFRCFSIPITLRSVIKRVQDDIRVQDAPEPVKIPFSKLCWTWSQPKQPVRLLPEPVSITNTNVTNSMSSSPIVATNLPNPPPYPGGDSWSHSNQQMDIHKFSGGLNRSFTDTMPQRATSTPPVSTMAAVDPTPLEQRPTANPLLATLLDANSPVIDTPSQNTNIVNESPMLSKLLEDTTSVAVNPFPTPNPNPRKRLGKRKSSKDMIAGKSPKHRVSDSDMTERTSERVNSERHGQGMGEKHIDLDSSAGSYDEPVRPSSVSSVGSIGGQSTSSMIDLTDSIGESHVKKLENSVDSIMGKESPHPSAFLGINNPLSVDSLDLGFSDFPLHHNQNMGTSMLPDPSGNFQQPPLHWQSRQTPPTPTSRNSPHHGVVPKNEKTSTSLEELLQGPRGRENEGPNSVHVRRNSQPRRQSFKRQNSTGRNSMESSSGGMSPDVFSPLIMSPSHNPLASPSQLPLSSPLSSVSPSSLTMISPSHPSNAVSPNLQSHGKTETLNHDSKSGIFGSQLACTTIASSQTKSAVGHFTSSGKPSLSLLKAQLEMESDVKFNSAISQERDSVSLRDEHSNLSSASSNSSQPPLNMKLKLSNMRPFESVSPSDGEDCKSRSSTYDFRSDDDDEFSLPKVDHRTVVSASPTRLQISNKSTLASFNKFNKSEKFKRKQREKELKQALSVDSGKRKRDKEECKKDKKKKKLNSSSVDKPIAVYKTTTVSVEGGNENDHMKRMPKLKITGLKSGAKISVENSLLQSKDIKNEKVQLKGSVKDEKSLDKLEKEAVVKIEKVEKTVGKLNSDIDNRNEKKKEKSSTTEGIFEKINAMKNEGLKNEDSNSSVDLKKLDKDSNSISHKKVKKLHKRSSSATKSDSKISKTPTIKLAPIKLPTTSASSITISRNPSTPSTPLTPKSISQSPTSTTIGKIGAVSLATSGSQKQLSNPTSKSPQGLGSAGKSSLSSRALPLAAKMNSNLQKNIQIQGPSGKNSPVPSSKSAHSRSSSTSALNISSGGVKQDKSLSKSLSTSSRTSSPSIEKEKSKSSSGLSRSSSTSGREREKSTSAGKASAPATTVNTQDVLSFLNPKEISNFTIPKLTNSQKASTPTSVNSPTIVSTCASTTVTTTTTNTSVKFSKGNSQPITQVSKGSSSGNSNANSAKNSSSSSGSGNVKNNTYNKGSSNFQSNSSNSRPSNLSVSNTLNSNRGGNNSPNSFSQKGGNNAYNKGSNPNSGNQGSGFRNFNNANASYSKTSNPTNSPSAHSNWNSSGQFSKVGHSSNHANQNSHRGNSASVNGKSGNNNGNSDTTNSGNRQVSSGSNVTSSNLRGTNLASNGPKGPGPPGATTPSESKKQGGGGQAQAAVRGRKGSLSAVIDKLTCKASGPSSNPASSGTPVTKGILQKTDQVIVNESPASPEMDAPALEPVKQENKVVIEEAPASPEPEISSPASLQNNRLSSANEIVSIPLENKPCQSSVNSDFSSNRTLTSDKSPFVHSSPKTIPLNSPPKEKQRPKTPTSDISRNVAKNKPLNPVSQQNGDIDSYHESKHTENSSTHSNDLVKTFRAKELVFKVPTPKQQDSVDRTSEELDSVNGKQKSKIDSKTPSEPNSPPSSPENGLIIDFSPSSLNHQGKTSTPPQRNSSSDSLVENHSSPNCRKSPSLNKSVTKLRSSPSCMMSPARETLNSAGSNSGSPAYADDDLDLMDEALMLGN